MVQVMEIGRLHVGVWLTAFSFHWLPTMAFDPIQPAEDWHYPAEEATEMQALLDTGLHVTRLDADSNVSGVLTLGLSNGEPLS